MARAVLRHILAFAVALNLIGGGSLPAAALAPAGHSMAQMQSAPANSMTASATDAAQSTPCDSMPCHCVPGKSTMADCLQMCLSVNTPLAFEPLGEVAAKPLLSHAAADWPADIVPSGRSIKPDPFPPKYLITV